MYVIILFKCHAYVQYFCVMVLLTLAFGAYKVMYSTGCSLYQHLDLVSRWNNNMISGEEKSAQMSVNNVAELCFYLLSKKCLLLLSVFC